MIHAAHQASLAAPDTERWLPIFYALDEFKGHRYADKNWQMGPIDDAKLPPARKARRPSSTPWRSGTPKPRRRPRPAWPTMPGPAKSSISSPWPGRATTPSSDTTPSSSAMAGAPCRTIGWQHAEPVLRSLARVVFELKPDALWKSNRELAATLPAEWQDGKLTPTATTDLLALMRTGSPADVSQKAVDFLKNGVSPQSIWDAAFAGVGELQMRQPARPSRWAAGIFSLHAATSLNALRYAYSTSSQEETRRLLLLQSVAIVPVFLATMGKRGGKIDEGRIDQLEPAPLKTPTEAAGEIFADIATDRGLAARKALAFLKDNPKPQALIEAARRGRVPEGRRYARLQV